jgi:adenine phosphoribosyltransferase
MRTALIALMLTNTSFALETADCRWIENYLTPVVDFPQEGIVFQWYANLLKDPDAFHLAIETFAARYREKNLDAILGLDSRGFIFGAALAYELKVPLVMVRKPGKLPRQVERIDYSLEYGKNSFEIEVDSLKASDRVLVIDDVFATGGTAQAACTLAERLGAEVVEVACLIELPALHGRKKVAYPVFSLIALEGE